MRAVLGNTVPYGMHWRSGTHPAQHLSECAVQTAQSALRRSLTFAVVLRRGLTVGVRGKVRERDLLREEQQKDTGQMQVDTPHVANIGDSYGRNWNVVQLTGRRNPSRRWAVAILPATPGHWR